ncbi:MalY/PatB family protein [Pelagibius sp. Alg239-R121]|uniref:MalY/PatB family protein n=1 Tax=Pelagibius sp. Alg239-R121 TaxID=2993448 RepID=UPI0024A7815E|nr:aminotransferase class I/II-fold pyridoxal phosphate-dependent enzyme [Pelagibius sp. Alg239-R121]
MSNFDQSNKDVENTFVRYSESMLNDIFGTTDVTPFWVADMDFTVANPIKAELQRITDRAQFAYEFNSDAVFAAITGWYQRRHDLTLDAAKFVQVPGVLTGIALLIRELTKKGDGVLFQAPAYHQFNKVIVSAGRKAVKSPLKIVDGRYEMDFDDLNTNLSADDVNAMILCNPHNPVGRVWTREEMEKVAEIANKHGVTIISDEIHSDIIYPGHTFTSLMSVDAQNHVALIGSPAKTFGMQSISNGYIYTENAELYDTMYGVSDSMYLGHGNTFTTFATIAAFDKGAQWVDELLIYLKDSIDWIENFLKEELPEVKMYPVEGTYQIWFDFSETGFSGDDLKQKYAEAGFGFSPGTWFDQNAVDFARMNIAAPRADIQGAFKRLKAVFENSTDGIRSTPVKAEAKTKQSCC